ncbi:MAG TPA: phosphotransferase, partial [Ktedonobacteraceae bacterium]|nr:phosphotransferase [Ktedonobacteraceae bacterium]
LTLDEQALEGAYIRFSEAQALQASIAIQPSGVVRVEDLGLSVQAFPADDRLPALAASCDTTQHSLLLQDLQTAARLHLGDQDWQLVSATAVPVRYKPSNRCVIRYSLILERLSQQTSSRKNITIFGKVYADPQQALEVQSLQLKLYQEQLATRGSEVVGHILDLPLLPQPLGMNKILGLTFNEAVQPANPEELLRSGGRALRPRMEYGPGGEITNVIVPTEELVLTAIALARLHTSTVQPRESTPRTGAKEAKRARERALLIAASNPTRAEDVRRLAQQLAARLETQHPDFYRSAHGGFKASQLLFHSHRVFVVDFDGFCLADSALDVGYFLAYLRPSGLWYSRPGMRQWFEASAKVFIAAYRQAMLELGSARVSVDGILERSRLYEAALLFKIATRRVNRLNSPRPQELSEMLKEIAACLSSESGRR